jgi:mRNA interferase MazF
MPPPSQRRYTSAIAAARIRGAITSQVKGYPFEVALPAGLSVSGVILADQVKSLDRRSRRATMIARLSDDVMEDLRLKLGALLQIPVE